MLNTRAKRDRATVAAVVSVFALCLAGVVFPLSACSGPESPPGDAPAPHPYVTAGSPVLEIPGQGVVYRACDGPNAVYFAPLGTEGVALAVVPNDPRCLTSSAPR